ncbi:D-glycero-beta-D-manno-heptose 1-phosphate adenylyltransferase [Pedobacter sp. SYSU D00535]|uniref:D-glycero-beta-D-manno-heptose 1-phosphate adenylyltransferase n=1 Tax=Pedobacter sp. SYSU D00535 TaxID=2810308 RepID=UPI001A97356D|nr:D-glycero-beta-D-manno-heptose 1-phosphate adenylyltransferase [Pedobacter sp. SYSU D00535]
MNKLQIAENKIMSLDQILRMVNIWRLKDQKIVFTNGCFDLLHLGHVDYLAKAADLGTKLIVGLNTDESTSRLKGPHRPITDQNSRSKILSSFFFIDAVVLFNEPTPLELITAIKPDILVKGADYTIDRIVGADFVLANGGEVQTISYIDGYSTSAIESKIKNS